MKIGVLTSSRADYGIYLPLLDKLKTDPYFVIELIAFGSHLTKNHGYTIDDIVEDEYDTIYEIVSLINDDSENGIAISYGKTVLEFAKFWATNKFDLVFCLGDRFEMSAAVQASIPFGVKLAHFHGGETTLGAIDNVYRHQITIASKFHFVSTDDHLRKVRELTGSSDYVYNVGSLSLANIKTFETQDRLVFLDKYGIENAPYLLATFHPETVSVNNNIVFAKEMKNTLSVLSDEINVVITMPNADTMGSLYRKEIYELKSTKPDKIFVVENFGKTDYFNAMFHCSFLLGNTSSGIIEAASLSKNVINVGNRQKGRAQSANVHNIDYDLKEIIGAYIEISKQSVYTEKNIYYKPRTVDIIINALKFINEGNVC